MSCIRWSSQESHISTVSFNDLVELHEFVLEDEDDEWEQKDDHGVNRFGDRIHGNEPWNLSQSDGDVARHDVETYVPDAGGHAKRADSPTYPSLVPQRPDMPQYGEQPKLAHLTDERDAGDSRAHAQWTTEHPDFPQSVKDPSLAVDEGNRERASSEEELADPPPGLGSRAQIESDIDSEEPDEDDAAPKVCVFELAAERRRIRRSAVPNLGLGLSAPLTMQSSRIFMRRNTPP